MRLKRLDLIRYGHFTNKSFDLPVGDNDFHIIFGPNEAGKSTALCAIEDLLFGIPMHSPYNFLHDYSSMRIGAVLENTGSSLEFLRRKGQKDTVLTPDGTAAPGGEGELRPYLAGADRDFFERMFSLDHSRLQEGGQEILQAKDDVGQMLFSAGAGMTGLRECLNKLVAEAEELWTARRSMNRKFYIAEKKLKEAQDTLRQLTLTANKWKELRTTYEKAEKNYLEIDEKIRAASAERSKLSRIRRVIRDIRSKQELDKTVAEFSDIVALPEDAKAVFEEAESKDTRTGARIETLEQQRDQAIVELNELIFDEMITQRAEDVRQLHERRIEVRGEKADLPQREAELQAAEKDLLAQAREIDWTKAEPDVLIERIPPRSKIAVIRALLSQKGELDLGITNCKRSLQESEKQHERLRQQFDVAGEPADISRLKIVIRAVREQGDLTGQVRTGELNLRNAQQRVNQHLNLLKPAITDETKLNQMDVPVRTRVQDYRDREQDWRRRLREIQQKSSEIRMERDVSHSAFERSVLAEQVVTTEELSVARKRRDALWGLVRCKYVLGKEIPESEANEFREEIADLANAFEPSINTADDLADRRFDHAEAAGRLAEMQRAINEQEKQLDLAQKTETALNKEGEALKEEWASLWESLSFDPLGAEDMLVWLDVREAVLEGVEARARAENDLESLSSVVTKFRQKLLGELKAIGADTTSLEEEALNMILEQAVEQLRGIEAEIANRSRLQEDLNEASFVLTQREVELKQAQKNLDEWQKNWKTAISDLLLNEETNPDAVSAQIDIIDQMRETAGRINSLRHERIEMIKLDVENFEKEVSQLIVDIAPDLADQPAEDAVIILEKRLDEAERIRLDRENKNEEVNSLAEEIKSLNREREENAASVAYLKQISNSETNADLMEAIDKSDQKRSLEEQREAIFQKLIQDGDGKTLEELEAECEGVIIDETAAHEESLNAELEDLRQQQTVAAENRSQARDELKAIDADDTAAQAEANRQEAITEMQLVAERYVRVKTSGALLQWATDRYRREKQAPLLKRAGELFKIITGNSFSGLQVAFDEKDSPELIGERTGGGIVPIEGMSTGTADQLYLALRTASIEDYLERANALPFVADDLFINFDDERAAAGFKLLGELAKKTQVLFFTHHQHLVDIAQHTFGNSIDLVNLTTA